MSTNSSTSDYTRNFDAYRSAGKVRGVLPHRAYCADFWDETIPQILDYLKNQGLKPEHKILDLGAGAFRCGLALIPYLNGGNYYALDINKYLIEDGYEYEIKTNNLTDKFPLSNIKITDDYNAEDFNIKFDYVWSFSLWTHLGLSECSKCLTEVSKVLQPGGVYLTTCFIVSDSEYEASSIRKSDVDIITNKDKDPYHHRFRDLKKIAYENDCEIKYLGIGSCCPRKHDVVRFVKK